MGGGKPAPASLQKKDETVGQYTIMVLPGDGIGPEVTEQAMFVLQAVAQRYKHTFTFHKDLVGIAAIEAEGEAITDATVEMCMQSDAILFGAVGGLPTYESKKASVKPEQALFKLRKGLQLFANLRFIRPYRALLDA